MIDQERLSRITSLKKGKNPENDDANLSMMEAVAWIAGEPWSDYPKCACRILSEFFCVWNERISDSERHILIPFIPRLVGTKSTDEVQFQRGVMAFDWLVRVHTPARMKIGGLNVQAENLERHPEIKDWKDGIPKLTTLLNSFRSNDINASGAPFNSEFNAAGSAAGSASYIAGWYAVRSGALTEASNSARSGALYAAWKASNIVGETDPTVLESTRTKLQKSALDLADRMIAVDQP